jgi:predicted proteasome-type protease
MRVADSRTNAGIDQIDTCRKMRTFYARKTLTAAKALSVPQAFTR